MAGRQPLTAPHCVVGIDVGGTRKGFHAVALRGGRDVEIYATTDAATLAAWCSGVHSELVAVDAPCRWRQGPLARSAERALMRDGLSCFVTPTREQAKACGGGFYGWMVCGETLYRELDIRGYPLAETPADLRHQRRCFETFPHAITSQLHRALGLEPAAAHRKREQRRTLLDRLGVDCTALTSIDWIDAALCAKAAQLLRIGVTARVYGDAVSGLVAVPAGLPASAA